MINAIFANLLGMIIASILMKYMFNVPLDIIIYNIFILFLGACSVWIGLYRDGRGW
jgi:uncharacterized membrane protein